MLPTVPEHSAICCSLALLVVLNSSISLHMVQGQQEVLEALTICANLKE